RLMLFVQRNEDFPVGGTDRRVVAKGQVDAADGQADVIEHRLYFRRWNHIADRSTDLVETFFRGFNAGAGGRPHVEPKLSSIDRRKKITSEEWQETKRKQKRDAHRDEDEGAMLERPAQ